MLRSYAPSACLAPAPAHRTPPTAHPLPLGNKDKTVVWDETVWVARARVGDQAAFEAIYEAYNRRIYGFILRTMGNPDDAFDLTQEVFIKAYNALNRTSPDLNLSAWLHRIASNACLDVLRRRKLIHWTPWEPTVHGNIMGDTDADDPERRLMQRETRERVQTVLNRMSDKYRLCLVMREYQEMSCEEIADVIGVSRAAVKSLLFRAREQFRVVYNQIEAETAASLINAPQPEAGKPRRSRRSRSVAAPVLDDVALLDRHAPLFAVDDTADDLDALMND